MDTKLRPQAYDSTEEEYFYIHTRYAKIDERKRPFKIDPRLKRYQEVLGKYEQWLIELRFRDGLTIEEINALPNNIAMSPYVLTQHLERSLRQLAYAPFPKPKRLDIVNALNSNRVLAEAAKVLNVTEEKLKELMLAYDIEQRYS